jgi:hypothetical protein
MASREESMQVVHELIEEAASSGMSVSGKSIVILRLAEAFAWLVNPNRAARRLARGFQLKLGGREYYDVLRYHDFSSGDVVARLGDRPRCSASRRVGSFPASIHRFTKARRPPSYSPARETGRSADWRFC